MQTLRNAQEKVAFFVSRDKNLEAIVEYINRKQEEKHEKSFQSQPSGSSVQRDESAGAVKQFKKNIATEKVQRITATDDLEKFLSEKNTSDKPFLGIAHVNLTNSVHSFAVAVLKEPKSESNEGNPRHIFLSLDSGAYGAYDGKAGTYDTSIVDMGRSAYLNSQELLRMMPKHPNMRGMMFASGVQFDKTSCGIFAGKSVEAMLDHQDHLIDVMDKIPDNTLRFKGTEDSQTIFHKDTQGRFFATNDFNFIISEREASGSLGSASASSEDEGKALAEKLVAHIQSSTHLKHLQGTYGIGQGIDPSLKTISAERSKYYGEAKAIRAEGSRGAR